jgi:GT2 family glycosyltransferase
MRIAAVVVTYNRLDLLKECIEAIRNQTRKLDEVIVVNNSSTDGTLEWLRDQKDLTVITQENLGSAGGFYAGIKNAYEKGYDWIWCMDDDVKPKEDALMKKNEFVSKSQDRIAAVSAFRRDKTTGVIYVDEIVDFNPYEIRVTRRFKRGSVDLYEANEYVKIFSATFEGVLINRKAVSMAGFPNKDFFIWADDSEYCSRLGEYGSIYHLRDSEFLRLIPNTQTYKIGKNELKKYMFGIRNVAYWQCRCNYANFRLIKKFFAMIFVLLYPFSLLRMQIKLKSKNDSVSLLALLLDSYKAIYKGIRGKLGKNL